MGLGRLFWGKGREVVGWNSHGVYACCDENGRMELPFFTRECPERYPHFHVLVHKNVKRYGGLYYRNKFRLKTVCTIKFNFDGIYTRKNLVYESTGFSWHNDLVDKDLDKMLKRLSLEKRGLGRILAYMDENVPSENEEWKRDVKLAKGEIEKADKKWRKIKKGYYFNGEGCHIDSYGGYVVCEGEEW